jgi:hypothetical protein
MSYWVKLIHSDTIIADNNCLLRSLTNIVLRTYSGKTLISVDDTGAVLFSKDFTANPIGYVASELTDIRVQCADGTGIVSWAGEITSVSINSDKLGILDYSEHTTLPTYDGNVELVTTNGQFGYLPEYIGTTQQYFSYETPVTSATTFADFAYFSIRNGLMRLAFFQAAPASLDAYLILHENFRFGSLYAKLVSYTATEISDIVFEPFKSLSQYSCLNFKKIADSSWYLCINIIGSSVALKTSLSNTNVLRYLATDTESSTTGAHTYTYLYITVIIDSQVQVRRYLCDFVSGVAPLLTLDWSKEITINGASYDFVTSGVIRDDSLILSIVPTGGMDIYICKFPKDCIKNGTYGDIIVSDGTTTALSSVAIPIAAETLFISSLARPGADSGLSVTEAGLATTVASIVPVETCGSFPFTPEIPNRDAFIDRTALFTSTANYSDITNTFTLPAGSIGYTFSIAYSLEFFCRYIKINYTNEAVVENFRVRVYDTLGTIIGESELQNLTLTSGYLLISLTETGYPISYIAVYKGSTETVTLSFELTVPTWSFPPQTNYVETREYLTDVSNSKEGELRAALRELPRTNLRYNNFFKTTPEFVQAKFVSEASVDGFISAPLWMDLTRVTNLTLGDTVISLTNLYHEWAVGTKVIVWGNYNTYEVSEITATSLTDITLADPLLRDYSVAYIMPLLTGITSSEISFQFNNNNRTADFNLLSTETYFEEGFNSPFIDLDGTVVTDEFGEFLYPEATDFVGYPIFEGTLINDGMSLSHSRESYLNDNEIGLLSKTDNELYTRESSSVSLVARTAEEIYLLKRKLDSLQGKFTAFWLPTKENDIVFSFASLTSGDTSFTVTFNQMAITRPKYLHIIGDTETVVKVARISNKYDGTETIHLLSALTTDILNITRIEVVHLMRSATESFELRYLNRNKAIVNFPVISVIS